MNTPCTRPWRAFKAPVLGVALLALAACGTQRPAGEEPLSPEQTRARVLRLLPAQVADRQGWARDIETAFTTRKIAPSAENICAVLAVTEQESNYQVDPAVPNMARVARGEIDRRAGRLRIPTGLVDAALKLPSSDGRSYARRLDGARTEHDLSAIFDDFIGQVPLGRTLFGNFNPVHTAGPMQVSIAFAEGQARDYPYPDAERVRDEVFKRRGGMYYGIVHLLGYPANYPQPLYRFADYNAGWYASRNAAFQAAVNRIAGVKLALDGDLLSPGFTPGATEQAVRSLYPRVKLRNPVIHEQLAQGTDEGFENTELYRTVFELADRANGAPMPRAVLPGIVLESPKITRHLTTAWFAQRVDGRYQRCLARGG